MQKQPITFKRGSDNVITVTMNPVVNVAGRTHALIVKRRKGDADPPEINPAPTGTVAGDGSAGQITFPLSEAQTIDLDAGAYFYEAWRMDAGNRGVIAEGPLVDEETVRIPA